MGQTLWPSAGAWHASHEVAGVHSKGSGALKSIRRGVQPCLVPPLVSKQIRREEHKVESAAVSARNAETQQPPDGGNHDVDVE